MRAIQDYVRNVPCASEYQYNKDMSDACVMSAWECLRDREPDLARFYGSAAKGFDLRNKKESSD